MFDQLARLNSDHLTFLAIMAGLLLASLTIVCSTLIVQIRRFRQRQLELGFREEMLRRGHSAHEIVQLLSSRRPTLSQSAAAFAGRVKDKLAAASCRLAEWTPRALARCRQRLLPFWNDGVALFRKGCTHASRFARQAWHDVRPLVHRSRAVISRCATSLSNGLDTLARRLAPNRP
jgi:hypothetical protein